MTPDAVHLARDPQLTDEEVLQRIRGGDVAWFEVLMRRYNPRVYRTVRAVLGSDEEAEDVMQQTYLAAFAHLTEFRGGARFSTWLTAIALNEARMRLRHSQRLTLVDAPEEREEEGRSAARRSPEQESAARELVGHVEQALDELPDTFRTCFVLREVEGLSTAEAAEVLGVSEDLVKTRLHRAKEALKERLLARVGEASDSLFEFRATRCDRVVSAVLAQLLPH